MYLRSIVSLCKEHWDKSSFVCDYKNLSFPSFSITENQYKKMVVENLTDMVRTIVLEDDFKIKENFGIDNFSFNMIEKSQEAKYKGNETREQRQVNLIFDQLFITKINKNIKDRDFLLKFNKKSISSLCSLLVTDQLNELSYLQTFSIPFGESNSSYEVQKDKLCASILMIKNEFPQIYSSLKLSMSQYPNQPLIDSINENLEKPTLSVVNHIMQYNNKTAKELFPKQVRELEKSNSFNVNQYKI